MGEEWIKPQEITFKEKIKLLFKPMKYIEDVGRDFMTIIGYKEMHGKVYVVKNYIIKYKGYRV